MVAICDRISGLSVKWGAARCDMPDHVHLLVEVDPQFGVHRLVKAIKGRSSRMLREEFPSLKSRLPTLWTSSYFVATVGGAPLEVMNNYVENQKNV
jgi:putative transposase